MNMEERVEKLERDVQFLRKELESLNLALTKVEQNLQGGTGPDAMLTGLTPPSMQLELLAAREMQHKHQEILKNNTIALVGLNDLLEQIRKHYVDSITEVKLDQREHLDFFQKMLSGSVESLRAEFLVVLRDFREKYPKLEALAQEEQQARLDIETKKLESNLAWTPEQERDLEARSGNLEQMIQRFINESYSSVVELFTYLLTKTEVLSQIIKENQV